MEMEWNRMEMEWNRMEWKTLAFLASTSCTILKRIVVCPLVVIGDRVVTINC